jgi:hypothetical protein
MSFRELRQAEILTRCFRKQAMPNASTAASRERELLRDDTG